MLVPNTNADAQLLPPYHLATPLLTEEQSVTTTNWPTHLKQTVQLFVAELKSYQPQSPVKYLGVEKTFWSHYSNS
jgi:hypothetical protein